ncbi:hypothetical protein K0M31_012545 [Melipona bicolor]|uniref:Uncharacterized protein n=1 Tax=Melipona bicolor TaxID=60889 RepID=A0AA40FJT8_9HYME|nr:hypothetical protein K0M31_012545 [Melipona bicolor]
MSSPSNHTKRKIVRTVVSLHKGPATSQIAQPADSWKLFFAFSLLSEVATDVKIRILADAFIKIIRRRRLELVVPWTNNNDDDDDSDDGTKKRRLARVACWPRTSSRMELRAWQPTSALAPIIRGFTVNSFSQTRVAEKERVNSIGLHWQSGENREETESGGREEAINSESCSKGREKGDKAECNLALDAEKEEEGEEEEEEEEEEKEEEEGPLAGGSHRCGARRGQSAAA